MSESKEVLLQQVTSVHFCGKGYWSELLLCNIHCSYSQFECPTSKRFLSEEAVTSYLEQLNIATCNPPARTPQLNIRTVAACPASMDEVNTRGEITDCSLMRGTSSAGYTEPNGMSTYLRTALPTSMPPIPEDPEPQQACQESSSPTIPPYLTISRSSDVSLRKKLPPHLAGVQIE